MALATAEAGRLALATADEIRLKTAKALPAVN